MRLALFADAGSLWDYRGLTFYLATGDVTTVIHSGGRQLDPHRRSASA